MALLARWATTGGCAPNAPSTVLAVAKRRNTGPSQCSRFGEAEPYAFIGAWLRAGSEYPDRDSHISFAPTVDIVQDYLQSSKDVIAAILGTPGHASGS